MRENKVSAKKTSRIFGIPKSTLHYRFSQQNKEEIACSLTGERDADGSEVTNVLPDTEERKILEYMTLIHRYGYHLSKGDLIHFAKLLASALPEPSRKKCSFHKYGWDGWYISFEDRIPILKNFTSLNQKFTSQNVRNYFEDLREIMDKYNLQDSPELIYKIDEIGVGIDNHPTTRPAHLTTVTNTSMYGIPSSPPLVTLIGCGNALGVALPPFFVANENFIFTESHASKGPPGTSGISKLEGISLMQTFIQKHFTRYVQMGNTRKSVLLLFNGNSSLLSVDDIKWARDQRIYLFVLPPHSYSAQKPVDPIEPFDTGLFSHFHFYAAEESRDFTGGYVTKTIDTKDISYIAGKAYHRCLSWEKLADSFKKCGIYPFSPKTYISALNSNMQMELKYFSLPPFGSKPPDPQVTLKPCEGLKDSLVHKADNKKVHVDIKQEVEHSE